MGKGGPSGGLGGAGSPSQRFGSGREGLSNVQEALPEVQEGSGGPPGDPGRVGRPSRRPEKGREALPKVWEALP